MPGIPIHEDFDSIILLVLLAECSQRRPTGLRPLPAKGPQRGKAVHPREAQFAQLDWIPAEDTRQRSPIKVPVGGRGCTFCWTDFCNTISESARSFNNGSQFGFIVYYGHLISPFFPLFTITKQIHDKTPNIYPTCFS